MSASLTNQANVSKWDVSDYLTAHASGRPTTRLYHYLVGRGLPAGIPAYLSSSVAIRPSAHAWERAQSKDIIVPNCVPAGARVVEVETSETGRPLKIVVRFPYSTTHDLCVVLRGNTLVTLWLNAKADDHSTLAQGRYNP